MSHILAALYGLLPNAFTSGQKNRRSLPIIRTDTRSFSGAPRRRKRRRLLQETWIRAIRIDRVQHHGGKVRNNLRRSVTGSLPTQIKDELRPVGRPADVADVRSLPKLRHGMIPAAVHIDNANGGS